MGLLDKIRVTGGGDGCLGMELSARAVKIAVMARKGKRVMLQGGVVSPIPKVSLSMDESKREALGQQISAVWRSAGVRSNRVRLSIPGKLTLTGRLKVSSSEYDHIEDLIFSILRKRLQLVDSKGDLNIDHFVYSKEGREIDVLYVAVMREVVEFYQGIFAYSELELVSLYSTPLALANVTNANYAKEMVDLFFILVDVGAYESNILAMKENRVIAHTFIDTGGILVTHNLASHTGLSLKDAEKMKLTGKGNESVLRESAYQLATQLGEGIERCHQEAAKFSGKPLRIETVYLTGGASHTPFLLAELSSILAVKVEHLLPIRKIELHPNLNPTQLYEMAPQLSVAIGTALIGV